MRGRAPGTAVDEFGSCAPTANTVSVVQYFLHQQYPNYGSSIWPRSEVSLAQKGAAHLCAGEGASNHACGHWPSNAGPAWSEPSRNMNWLRCGWATSDRCTHTHANTSNRSQARGRGPNSLVAGPHFDWCKTGCETARRAIDKLASGLGDAGMDLVDLSLIHI